VPTDTGQTTAAHEGWQEPGTDEQWSDSFYFGGGDGRGLAFYSRIGRRPNEGKVEGALGVWLPGEGFLLSFGRAKDASEIACGAVSFRCLDPLVLWELRLEGQGRLFERAEHVGTNRDRYRTVDVGGWLRFTSWHPPLSFRSGLAEWVATDHYEQPGSIAGVIEAGDGRWPLAGNGLRDHSWGVRDWQQVPFWRWFGMVVDPDNFAMVNNVGLSGGGEAAGGFVMRKGEIAPVASCDTDSELDMRHGWQRRFEARVTDDLGRETVLHGEALEVAPLRQRRAGRVTFVNEALTEYRWEDRRAIGISEYLVQQPAGGNGAGRG